MFDTECDCPRGPSRHPHAVHATNCATRLREKAYLSSSLYGEAYYVTDACGAVVDVLFPTEIVHQVDPSRGDDGSRCSDNTPAREAAS